MLRSLRTMLIIRPSSSNSITGSGRSKSIEPRACRAAIEQQRELFHAAEIVHERRVALGHLRIAFEHLVDVGVRHALGGANHARREFGADHFAGRVHFHDRAHHQAVYLRIQRADAVRKLFGQHRHGAIREINGSAAQARLAIERASRAGRNAPRRRCAPAIRSARSASARRKRRRRNRARFRRRS